MATMKPLDPVDVAEKALKKAAKKDKKRKRNEVEAKMEEVSGEGAVAQQVEETPAVADAAKLEEGEEEVEVEAISHKEARKRRKLEKKLAKSGAPPPLADTKPSTSTAPSKPKASTTETIFTTSKRSPYGVWVGNLHFSTTPQHLVTFFSPSPSAPSAQITRMHMPAGKRPGEANKGFAYVDFETREGQEEAVKMSEGHLEGRRLLIKASTDFTGRPAPSQAATTEVGAQEGADAGKGGAGSMSKTARRILDSQKQPPAPCLFLGNLGFATTEESILQMFDAHHRAALAWKPKSDSSTVKGKGKVAANGDASPDETGSDEEDEAKSPEKGEGAGIRKVRLGTFEDSGKCKGWAFVDFLSTSQATSSLTNPRNHTLDGRKLVVEYASPDAVRRGGHSEGFAAAAAANGAARGGGKGKGRVGKKERLAKKADVDPSALEAEPVEAFATTALEMANEAAEGAVRPLKKKEAFKGRQKPGAALANAKRGRTGIVKGGEGMGKKVVFS